LSKITFTGHGVQGTNMAEDIVLLVRIWSSV